jgi:O-antigen/teichoic acid export membrane protein
VNSGVFFGVLRALEMYKTVAFFLSASAALKILLSLVFYDDIDSLLQKFIVADIFVWSCGSLYALITSKYKDHNATKPIVRSREFIKTSLISWVNQVLDLPLTQLDRVVVAFVAGNETAAIFNLIRRLASLFNQLGEPLYQVYLNQFSGSNFRFSHFSPKAMFQYSVKRVGVPVVVGLILYPIFFPYIDTIMFDSSLQNYYVLLFLFLLITASSITFIWINPLYFLHVSEYRSIVLTFICNFIYVTSLIVVFKFFTIYESYICLLSQIAVNYTVKYYEIRKSHNHCGEMGV